MWYQGNFKTPKGSLSSQRGGYLSYEVEGQVLTLVSRKGRRYPLYMNRTKNGSMTGCQIFKRYAASATIKDDMLMVKFVRLAGRTNSSSMGNTSRSKYTSSWNNY